MDMMPTRKLRKRLRKSPSNWTVNSEPNLTFASLAKCN